MSYPKLGVPLFRSDPILRLPWLFLAPRVHAGSARLRPREASVSYPKLGEPLSSRSELSGVANLYYLGHEPGLGLMEVMWNTLFRDLRG